MGRKSSNNFLRRQPAQTEESVRDTWRSADAVCFDVDSTVCMDEAIDELAKFIGVGEQVEKITQEAMLGGVSFRESLRRRLSIIRPSMNQTQQFISTHPPLLTKGIRDLVRLLHNRRVPVYLVSGGFFCVIEVVAEMLAIPKKNIFANRLQYFFNGDYAGFDETQPTSEEGGKPAVIRHLQETFGYKSIIHIGDGATDLEACPPAAAFIGFGGNQIRESVRRKSKWYVTSFQDLIDELSEEDEHQTESS